MKAKYLVPVAAIAATWAVRRGLESGYRAAFHREPPTNDNEDARLESALVWAVTTAAAIAVVDVLISRVLAPRLES